jgi:serine/threonine-protein kinase
MGTPVYMSPEQCRGAGAVDSRADIYSMGCILYQLVCGHPPFVAEGAGEIIAAQLYAEPQPLASLVPEIPRELDIVVARCLAKLPKDRPQTMEEVAIGLGGTLSHPPVGPKSFPIIAVRTSHTMSSPGKRNILIGGAVAALAVVGGITAATLGARSPAAEVVSAAAPEPAPAPPPDVKPLVAPEPAPVAPAVPEPAPAPPPPVPAAAPVPTTINLKLFSDPAGAEIYRVADGIKLGVTPLDQQMQRSDGFAVFTVKLAGYEDARIELPADKDGEMAVTLTKIVAAAPRVTRNVKRPEEPAAAPAKPAAKPGAINDGALDPFAK